MNARQLDKCKGKWIAVRWTNGQTGTLVIKHRRPRTDVIETTTGQVFEGRGMELIAVFPGVEVDTV